MSIAQNVIDIVKDEMVRNDVIKLRSIHLSVGKMSAIVPEALTFCFEIVIEGTELEGTKLTIDMAPLIGYCHVCNKEFEIEDYNFTCPTCGDKDIETISGRDLTIIEIEVD